MVFTDINMIRINKIITKLIANVGTDKITYFLMGETISLFSLL